MRRLALAVAAASVLAAGAAGLAAAEGGDVEGYASGDIAAYGVGLTGVGLPDVGAKGAVGAGDLPGKLATYHDSGLYDSQLSKVARAATDYLVSRLEQKSVRNCTVRYKLVRHHRGRKPALYRRLRRCKAEIEGGALTGKPAVVLDIDETSLSNYSAFGPTGYSSLGTVLPALTGTGTAIKPTLDFYRLARDRGVAVFFITGRPGAIESVTANNLKAVGYDRGWDDLVTKPGDVHTVEYKAGERRKIEESGYDIVVNMGDQESDLRGGHAERAFKLPNPFYFIGDE